MALAVKTRLVQLVILLALVSIPATIYAEIGTFAIVSDTHVGASNSVYQGVAKELENRGIKTIIHTGDAINRPGNKAQWAKFSAETGAEKLLLTPGNHDIRDAASFATYLGLYGNPYHSFADGDTLFVLLNTEIPGQRRRIVGEQLAWLKTELNRPFRYKFVFLHEPLFSFIPLNGLDRHRAARDALHALFVENGVSLVIAGHDHVYDRTVRDGVEYVVQGAEGGRLPWFAKASTSFRYMTGTRNNEGYTFVVRDVSGAVRDRFSIDQASARVALLPQRDSFLARLYQLLAERISTRERLGISSPRPISRADGLPG
jgi:3',5'-cyclic AMP phosphodiesterase CpdA